MCDYPDPDEEYELMYSDELDLLREIDDKTESNPVKKKLLSTKRSLDFSSPDGKRSGSKELTNVETVSKNAGTSVNSTPMDDILPSSNVSNKRTVEDLFGDINDIDFDNIHLPSKKQKTEEECDMELISKIIEGRKQRQLLNEPSSRGNVIQLNYDVNENLTINVPSWPFMPVTNWNGDRIYVRFEDKDSWESSLDRITNQFSLKTLYTSVWEEARKIIETKKQRSIESNESLQQTVLNDNVLNELWVEKYRPKSYVELLSEEPVNRALLHWLHLWDKVVFKKDVKTKEPHHRNAFSKRTGQFQLSNKWKGKKENEPELDEDGRPHHKVALLCGPPGVGKTTLAHLLARLAGYRPVELNASDERSTEAFQTALQNATLMQSVLDRERRPNCLILDEIDGAPIQTVELLVKWCTSMKKDEGKKKGKSQPLKRPVIAICNDLYATSLRPLRAVALIVFVGSTSAARLSARLARVSRAEHVRVTARALNALAARVRGDVRAALHLLAFLKARDRETINIEDVENIAIGTKDNTTSMMQALQAIFTLNDNEPNSILKTIQAAGEYDRIVDGIFENYLNARVDSRLHIACETISWLRLYDTLNSWTQRNQNYSLYPLLPMCIAKCHNLLATRQTIKVKFPMQAQEMTRRRAELEAAVASVRAARADVSRRALRLDLLPLLPHVLTPALRSANVQLCSENERKSLKTCAGAMCDYGLQYIQQRTPEGLYAFMLEPDIYKVAFFGSEERLRPPPALRQAIAREQQLEIIRRNENMMNRTTSNKQSSEVKTKTDKQTNAKEVKAQLPNHLQRLQPKVIEKTAQVHKDFFGRIVPISQAHKHDAETGTVSSSGVFYQYREGFNNAVRRNVRMRDLL